MSLDRLEAVLRDAVECRYRPNLDDIDAQNILFAMDGLRQQLAESNAEIERLRAIDSIAREYGIIGFVDIEQIHNQLAASQALNHQLREALECYSKNKKVGLVASIALALPQDTTALDAIVQRAGEVMRERCADAAEDYNGNPGEHDGTAIGHLIRALPDVTRENLWS